MEDQPVQQHNATIGCRKGVTIGSGKIPGCLMSKVKLFHEACAKGNLVEVKRFVCQGIVDVNCPGEEEEEEEEEEDEEEEEEEEEKTAVMIAAEMKQEHIFDFLVASDADLLALSEENNNVLHYACKGGSAYIVKKLLIDHKMKTDEINEDEKFPLMIALNEGHIPVVKLLLDRGVDITPNEYQDSMLHEACIGGHVEMVNYVLSLKIIDLESRGTAGRTPLMFAVCKGHLPVLILLKAKGADAKTIDDNGNNIIINACMRGHVEIVTYVLSLNIIDINYKGQFGRTAFMHSVCHGAMQFVELLREKGSDITMLDMYEDNILHLACEGGRIAMVKYVLSLNVSDIETRGRSGRTPIMTAVFKGNMETVKFLYKHHNASITKLDDESWCVMHYACLNGYLNLLKYLLTLEELKGFENRGDKYGTTPLQVARDGDETEIVNFLLSRQNKN